MKIDMVGYLNGEADAVTTAWLDQMFAACDELRNQAGIESDRKMPWPRAFDLMTSMWGRLIKESFDAGRHCGHVDAAAPQPTVIIPEFQRAFCTACASDCDWRQLAWDATAREVRKIKCDCCQRRPFRTRQDVWCERMQFFNFIAPLRLCFECRGILFYDRDHFYNPPDAVS